MTRENIPWRELRSRYEEGQGTFRTLAAEYGVGHSTVAKRAKRENWGGHRRKKSGEDRTAACLHQAAAALSRCVEESLLCADQPPEARELKELLAVLRELMQLRRTLEQERQAEEPAAIRVVLEGEIADWAE